MSLALRPPARPHLQVRTVPAELLRSDAAEVNCINICACAVSTRSAPRRAAPLAVYRVHNRFRPAFASAQRRCRRMRSTSLRTSRTSLPAFLRARLHEPSRHRSTAPGAGAAAASLRAWLRHRAGCAARPRATSARLCCGSRQSSPCAVAAALLCTSADALSPPTLYKPVGVVASGGKVQRNAQPLASRTAVKAIRASAAGRGRALE